MALKLLLSSLLFASLGIVLGSTQCWDNVSRTYLEGGDKNCWNGLSQREEHPCSQYEKKGKGHFLCVQGKSLPQACASRQLPGGRVDIGQGEAFKGMWYTCIREDAYSGGECDVNNLDRSDCEAVWEMTACVHENRKMEENGDTWTVPGHPFFFHCAKDAYGNISKQTAGCISNTGEWVRIGSTDVNGSRCIKQSNNAVALIKNSP